MSDEHIEFELSASVHVNAPTDQVYAVASDITRMGEWSPECVGGEWVSGTPGAVGARFRGHNRAGDDEWSTDCEVVTVEDQHTFAWCVLTSTDAGDPVWSFEIDPAAQGCTLTQRFRMPQAPERLLRIRDSLPPEKAATFLEYRRGKLREGMQQTVDGIKRSVET